MRYLELDVYRGIAIILVILFHSICSFPVDLESKFGSVKNFILVFFLQIFFIVSGLLYKDEDCWRVFLKKKTMRIFVPWFIFVIASISMRILASSFTRSQIGGFFQELILAVTTGRYYWFLYALFIMMIMTKLAKNKYVITLLGMGFLILYLADVKIPWNYLNAKNLIVYYPWFVAGVISRNYYAKMSNSTSYHIHILSIISLILFISLFLSKGVWINIHYLNFLCSIFLCWSVWVLSIWIIKVIKEEKALVHLGIYSLQYYLNHLLIMLPCYYVGSIFYTYSQFLSLVVNFMLALIISWLILMIEKRSSVFRRLCGL